MTFLAGVSTGTGVVVEGGEAPPNKGFVARTVVAREENVNDAIQADGEITRLHDVTLLRYPKQSIIYWRYR